MKTCERNLMQASAASTHTSKLSGTPPPLPSAVPVQVLFGQQHFSAFTRHFAAKKQLIWGGGTQRVGEMQMQPAAPCAGEKRPVWEARTSFLLYQNFQVIMKTYAKQPGHCPGDACQANCPCALPNSSVDNHQKGFLCMTWPFG